MVLNMQCERSGYAGLRSLVMLVRRVKAAHKPDEVVEIARFTESGQSSRSRRYIDERFEKVVFDRVGESRGSTVQQRESLRCCCFAATRSGESVTSAALGGGGSLLAKPGR